MNGDKTPKWEISIHASQEKKYQVFERLSAMEKTSHSSMTSKPRDPNSPVLAKSLGYLQFLLSYQKREKNFIHEFRLLCFALAVKPVMSSGDRLNIVLLGTKEALNVRKYSKR